jgi:8-amino-7-oxononanoate synthase
MGTLSKALAASGGYIAGSAPLIDYLKHTTPGFVFSVGLSPADTAAALAALTILRREPERVARMQERARLFLDAARRHGLNTGSSMGTPVVPVIIGDPDKCLLLSSRLLDAGINVFPILPPGVTNANSRLRFFITAAHSEDQILKAVITTARLWAELRQGSP